MSTDNPLRWIEENVALVSSLAEGDQSYAGSVQAVLDYMVDQSDYDITEQLVAAAQSVFHDINQQAVGTIHTEVELNKVR